MPGVGEGTGDLQLARNVLSFHEPERCTVDNVISDHKTLSMMRFNWQSECVTQKSRLEKCFTAHDYHFNFFFPYDSRLTELLLFGSKTESVASYYGRLVSRAYVVACLFMEVIACHSNIHERDVFIKLCGAI